MTYLQPESWTVWRKLQAQTATEVTRLVLAKHVSSMEYTQASAEALMERVLKTPPEKLWVNSTGEGVALCWLLDELKIPYTRVTILGAGRPPLEGCAQASFRWTETNSGAQLKLLSAH